MRVRAACLGVGLSVVGCASDVTVVDGDGAGGAMVSVGTNASSAEATSATTGSGGAAPATTGSGGAGGAAPLPPVPGCEALVPMGEPIVLPGLDHPTWEHLVAIDEHRAGILYKDRDGTEDVALSQTFEGAFDAWPPVVTDPVEHARMSVIFSEPRPLTSRPDTTVGVAITGDPVGAGYWARVSGYMTFGVPGVVEIDGIPMLEPAPGTGAYVLDVTDSGLEIGHVATTDPAEPVQPVATLSGSDSDPCIGVHLGFGSDGVLWSLRGGSTNVDCPDGPSEQELSPVQPNATPGDTFTLDFSPRWRDVALLPRPSGVWVAVRRPSGVEIIPFGPDGAEDAPRVRPLASIQWTPTTTAFARWREGVAVAHRDWVDGDGRLAIAVTDGEHLTEVLDIPASESFSDPAPTVTASTDGRSLLVSYHRREGIFVQRVDCVTPE